MLGVVAVAHCGRLHKATLRPLEPHGVLGAWCYSDWAYTHRSKLRAMLSRPVIVPPWWVLLLLGVVAVAHCGRLHKATLRPLEPHGVLGAWCYSDRAYTHRSELRAMLSR